MSPATAEQTEFSFPDEVGSAKEKQVVSNEKQGATENEIEVVDDTPEADRNRTPMTDPPQDPTEEELKTYSADVQKRFKHFTKGYHDERRNKEVASRERDEAIRIARAVMEENQRLKGTLVEGQSILYTQTKASLESEVAAAKKALMEAQELFDPQAITDAQDTLFDAKIKLDRVNNFRPAPVQSRQEDVQTQPTPQRQQPSPDPKALAWQQRNSWFGTDDEMTAYTLGLHKKLVSEGVDPRSDTYYQRLDARVQKLFPEKFESGGSDDSDTPNRTSVVAPATRSTAPRKIVLTTTQVQLAKKLGVPLELYAKHVAMEQRNK